MNIKEKKVIDMAHPQLTQFSLHSVICMISIIMISKQRIEGFWSQLRNSVTDYWINVFKAWQKKCILQL